MKITDNFDIREFVPKSIWETYGARSTWFIDERIPQLAQFYKDFFKGYFIKDYASKGKTVTDVLIIVNNWHYGGTYQERGFRLPTSKTGASLSSHKFGQAFDCDIKIKFSDGLEIEADYTYIHKIIKANKEFFMSKGLTTLEDVFIAKSWLHSDIRWIKDQTEIFVVKP